MNMFTTSNKSFNCCFLHLHIISLFLLTTLLIPFNKHPKIEPYLEEPMALTKEEQEERERKKAQESLLRLRAVLKASSERKKDG